MVLKDPCYELSDAKPKDIPAMIPKILNLIRMIWVNSEFYKTRERLTGILKKVRVPTIERLYKIRPELKIVVCHLPTQHFNLG